MIRSADVQVVELPLARPMATAIHRTESVFCALLRVNTDDAQGQSFVFSLNRERAFALKHMIQSLNAIYLGQDERDVDALWNQAMVDINPVGTQGFAVSALTAWDTALWDAIGLSSDVALADHFGRKRDWVPAYASSGLWLNQSIDELITEACEFVDKGFRSVKLRVDGRVERDTQRATTLRNVLGNHIEILVDANQSLSPEVAVELAKSLEPIGIGWFEEPVLHSDLAAQRHVRENSSIRIASGETDYTARGMRPILESGATDVLMPDLQRIGGLGEMRRVADLAASFNTPISTHIFTEYSLCIAGSAANCISVEHVDWFSGLFTDPIEIKDGQARIPTSPGTGFRFDEDRVRDCLIGA